MSNEETSINETLNPNASFTTEHKNQSFTDEQIKEYNLTPKEEPESSDESLILGKFKSQDDLEKAYKELETKYHGKGTNDGTDESQEEEEGVEEDSKEEDKPTDEDIQETDEPDEDSPRGKVNAAFQSLSDTGELTDEVMKSFEEAGISKELVTQFKELSDFKATTELQAIVSEVGSQEDYDKLISWAGKNLSKDEINTFDTIIDEGSVDEIKLAINNLKSKHSGNDTPVKPKSDNLIKADIVTSVSGAYSSQSEMMSDMNDPRYRTDEKFRESVMKKVSKSNF